MAARILVFVERRDGKLKRPSLEAVSAARRLADASGGAVDALVLGAGAGAHATELAKYGADRVLAVDRADLDLYVPAAYAAVLAEAAKKSGADLVVASATAMGRDVAPRASARLGSGCLSDLVEIALDASGAASGRRPVYSGKASARVRLAGAKPGVVTLRPNVFPAIAAEGRTVAVEAFAPDLPAALFRCKSVGLAKPEAQELDVAEASIIVSGGRGLKAPENFAMVRDLASALGAAVGASRAVVDAGWIPHAHQVGQTGKVVSPNLYIACGISGAIQHLAGMSSAKVIVAINKDPEAPIFKIADYGIVGDVFEVVPKLTEAVRKLKEAGA